MITAYVMVTSCSHRNCFQVLVIITQFTYAILSIDDIRVTAEGLCHMFDVALLGVFHKLDIRWTGDFRDSCTSLLKRN